MQEQPITDSAQSPTPEEKQTEREAEEKALRGKTHVRTGITKNHSRKCQKSRRQMARQSRRINRQRG